MDNERKLSLNGLPPLPKSLIAAASDATRSNTASPLNHTHHGNNNLFLGASTSAAARNQHGSERHGSLSSTQESLSDRESLHSRASSSHSSHYTPTNSTATTNTASGANSTLDTQIAMLRREMYGLRQLDLSLLSQLWALNESIQSFRVVLQEQDGLSPPSHSPTPSNTNSISSEAEDESYPVMVAQGAIPKVKALPGGSTTSHASTSSASGASGSSSAASSMGKHGPAALPPQKQHPQLPRILQQRMRRAPPPPPPPHATRPPNKGHVPQRPI